MQCQNCETLVQADAAVPEDAGERSPDLYLLRGGRGRGGAERAVLLGLQGGGARTRAARGAQRRGVQQALGHQREAHRVEVMR